MAEPATELTLDSASLLASEEHEVAIVGRSPWYLAWRRLRDSAEQDPQAYHTAHEEWLTAWAGWAARQ